jgi:hypothetical protein
LGGGEDWVEEHKVMRVIDVLYTKSSPRGAVRFVSLEGGFRVIGIQEVCEVIPPVKRPSRRSS